MDLAKNIELSQQGDKAAYAEVVRHYQSLISGITYNMTGDFHKSEDLAQETFLVAWNKLGELTQTTNPTGWFCTIARNLAHRSFRKKQEKPTETLEEQVSPQPDPADALLRREQSELIWSTIETIPEPYRETLVLYYRSGQSVRAISEATGVSEESVRQRLVRARKSLKTRLETLIGDVLSETVPGEAFTLAVMATLPAAAMLATTAEAATVAAAGTGTAVATGKSTGTALGTATIWSVIGPAVWGGWLVLWFFSMFWAAVRNAPTLRARRFRVYTVFWSLQYYALFSITIGAAFGGITGLYFALFRSMPHPLVSTFVFIAVFVTTISCIVPFQLKYYRKLKGIIENDLGLPGPYIESYTYPQLERRFFLSMITNFLLAETILALFVGIAVFSGEGGDPKFFVIIFGLIAFVAAMTAVYYPLGRYFLEISRTKQNFLAAPPLVDNPFEIALQKIGRHPGSVDHPTKAGGMFGVMLLTWTGFAGFGVFYFAQYSWDKHPVPLGICAALLVAAFTVPTILGRRMKEMKASIAWLMGLSFSPILISLILALEYIEFGRIDYSYIWTGKWHNYQLGMLHGMNRMMMFMAAIMTPVHLYRYFKMKREESDDAVSGRETLVKEAIARFDPVTMIDDEPEVKANPFPRRWLWILGLYAAAIVVLFCVGVLIPNPYAHKKRLERNNNFTALIELEPENAEWYYKRGSYSEFFDGGPNAEKAIADFDMAIKLKPDYAWAYNQRAQARKSLRRGLDPVEVKLLYLQSLADINEAIRLEPNDLHHLLQRAWIYVDLGDHDAAESDFNEVVRRQPKPDSYRSRGNFYQVVKNDLPRALADYRKALAIARREVDTKGYSEFPLEILERDLEELVERIEPGLGY